ncbi:hypothetical protein MACH15_03480 [Maricaulis maris]|nr:hypothetical protein MACH15_03480 [Maricaulis maris]
MLSVWLAASPVSGVAAVSMPLSLAGVQAAIAKPISAAGNPVCFISIPYQALGIARFVCNIVHSSRRAARYRTQG